MPEEDQGVKRQVSAQLAGCYNRDYPNASKHGKSGQASARTPARVKAGAGPLSNGPHSPAEGQVVAGTMAQKLTGRSSHPSTNWLAWTYTFLPTGGTPYRAV